MDIVIKLIGLAGSLFAVYKAFMAILNLRKDSYKKDFEVAEKYLLSDLNQKHDYLVEVGYAAITGKRLDASLIRYFLSKKDPSKKLSDYYSSMKYIKINRDLEKNILSLDLIDEINDKKKLKIKRIKIAILYIIYFLLALSPLFFLNEIIKNNLSIVAVFSIPFMFLAGLQIYEIDMLNKAENLSKELNG